MSVDATMLRTMARQAALISDLEDMVREREERIAILEQRVTVLRRGLDHVLRLGADVRLLAESALRESVAITSK